MVLDDSYRLILMQFSFSNPKVVPKGIKNLGRETLEDWLKRKKYSGGTMIIGPTENCFIDLEKIDEVDYKMVDAFYQERINNKPYNNIYYYHMLRFTFARHEVVDISEEFKRVRDNMRAALMEMCRVAMWRVRIFSNPFYQNGKEVPGQRVLSINLDARKPLFQKNGKPIMVWKNGNKVQIEPEYCLQIDE